MKALNSKNGIFWIIAFAFLFLLSQDYLFIEWEVMPSFWGFPKWLLWFGIIQVLFITTFYWFSKKYWKE